MTWFLQKGYKHYFAVVVVLIVATILRLPLIQGSFWLDEAAQALESARPLIRQFDIAHDFQPPLLHLIVHAALYISDSEWWLRTVGALMPGLITIWATWAVGKKLHSSEVGLLAAFFLATNSFHIYFSQELRPYSLPAMFATLSWLPLISGLRTRKQQVAFTLLTLAGLYSSYLYGVLILAQAMHVYFKHRPAVTSFIVSLATSSIAFLPWLPMLFKQLERGGEVRSTLPGWDRVVSLTQFKSLFVTLGKFVLGVIPLDISAPVLLSMALLAITTAYLVWKYQLLSSVKKATIVKYVRENSALVLWIVLPLAASWLVSFYIPILRPKRVVYLLPAFYLLLAELFSRLRKKDMIAATVIVLLINGLSLYHYWSNPVLQRENWRKLHTQITQSYDPSSSSTVFAFSEPYAPWMWYNQGAFPSTSTGVLSTEALDEDGFVASITQYQTLLVFDYLRDLTDPEDRVISLIKQNQYTETDVLDTPNIGFVRVYQK